MPVPGMIVIWPAAQFATRTVAPVEPSDTAVLVADASGAPTAPFELYLTWEGGGYEPFVVTSVVGNTFYATRDGWYDGEIPTGAAVTWDGWAPTALPAPEGWAICDGTNGTPDLRGRVVPCVGATLDSESYAVGDTGGAATFAIPEHIHGPDTLVLGAEDPYPRMGPTDPTVGVRHTHAAGANATDDATPTPDYWFESGTDMGIALGGSGGTHHHDMNDGVGGGLVHVDDPHVDDHSHTFSGDFSDQAEIADIGQLPPCRACYYVMFVGA